MKFFAKVAVISVVSFSMLTLKAYATTGTVNVDATRIRKEQNTTSDILTNVYKDEEVEILEDNGEWLKIKYGDYTGYVKSEFITTSSSNTNSTNTSSNNSVTNEISTNVATSNTTSSESSEISEEVEEDGDIVLASNVNLRISPNVMSSKIESISQGVTITTIDTMGNWSKITDGTVSGWVLSNQIKTTSATSNVMVDSSTIETVGNETNTKNTVSNSSNTTENTNTTSSSSATSVSKTGTINVETAKVRESASSSATVVGFLDYGDEVSISEENGDWYKISTSSISGYVNKTLITVKNEDSTNTVSSRGTSEERENENTENIETVSNTTTTSGENVVEYAMQFLGYPYVSGGKSPSSGFDCSGFTRYVYLNFGYDIGNSAASQANNGTEISRENLKLGDLLLFYDDGKNKIGHTGIYTGDGNFIHSANPERGVVIDNLNTSTYYSERFISARRIVE